MKYVAVFPYFVLFQELASCKFCEQSKQFDNLQQPNI